MHAKVVVADDRLLRVGSSNLNNRWMGFDTECDLAIKAREGEETTHRTILGIRDQLLAESDLFLPDRAESLADGLPRDLTEWTPSKAAGSLSCSRYAAGSTRRGPCAGRHPGAQPAGDSR